MTPILLLMFLFGYAVGLFNTSWMLQRLMMGSDLRTQGSGNLGAHNLFDVTGKAWLAVGAAVVDAAKGAVVVLVAGTLHPTWFAATAFAGVGVVFGHNYNVFLKWKGGRGLATAAGAGLMISPPFVITWCLMYLMAYGVIRRNVHVASLAATLATAVLALSVPDKVFAATSSFVGTDISQIRWTVVAMVLPIFQRFIAPVRDYIRTTVDEEE